MNLTPRDIAQKIDLSAVKAEDGDQAIQSLADCACRCGCYLVTTLPSQTAAVIRLLGEDRLVKVGGNVGFPSGGQTPAIKAAEARELVRLGVDEIDMVISVGHLVSGHDAYVRDEIRAVVAAAEGRPVKVILECHYLDRDQILRGCDACLEAQAAFVKTGTGWTPTGATLDNIALIKNHVGDRIRVKASGGVRDLATVIAMLRLGVDRFGIGQRWVPQILAEVASSPAGSVEV